jgi:hypothetical protein
LSRLRIGKEITVGFSGERQGASRRFSAAPEPVASAIPLSYLPVASAIPLSYLPLSYLPVASAIPLSYLPVASAIPLSYLFADP